MRSAEIHAAEIEEGLGLLSDGGVQSSILEIVEMTASGYGIVHFHIG